MKILAVEHFAQFDVQPGAFGVEFQGGDHPLLSPREIAEHCQHKSFHRQPIGLSFSGSVFGHFDRPKPSPGVQRAEAAPVGHGGVELGLAILWKFAAGDPVQSPAEPWSAKIPGQSAGQHASLASPPHTEFAQWPGSVERIQVTSLVVELLNNR